MDRACTAVLNDFGVSQSIAEVRFGAKRNLVARLQSRCSGYFLSEDEVDAAAGAAVAAAGALSLLGFESLVDFESVLDLELLLVVLLSPEDLGLALP